VSEVKDTHNSQEFWAYGADGYMATQRSEGLCTYCNGAAIYKVRTGKTCKLGDVEIIIFLCAECFKKKWIVYLRKIYASLRG
jgi:hypothetical protein